MSTNSKNWFKFGGLVGLAFVLGLFFAGLLDLPRAGMAQQREDERTPIVAVDAPRIPEAKPLAELSEAYSAIAEAVRPSVVFVQAEKPQAARRAVPRIQVPPGFELPEVDPDAPGRTPQLDRSTGSGFIVSADGYIVTNNHVIEGATRVRVQLLDGRTFDARTVGSDPNTDVAVLKVEASGLKPASLGSSDRLRVGEWVLAIGNPLGDDLTFSVTQGIVSAKGRGPRGLERSGLDILDFIQTDAAINRGNSGGPLVNVRGEVVGINSAIASLTGYYQGYAFAVPIDLARKVMNQIIEHGRVERTKLGIIVETATAEDAAYLGLDSIAGVKINDFESAGSPARRAGMEPGDVIIAIDGQPVKYTAQLQQLVGFRRAGETVRVEVARKSGRKEFTVRLDNVDRTPLAAADSAPSRAPATTAPKNPLGLSLEPVTPALATRAGVPTNTRGLLVRSIANGSPAEDLLLSAEDVRTPDIITAVEGRPVRTEAELRSALSNAHNGVVSLTVVSARLDGGQSVKRVRVP